LVILVNGNFERRVTLASVRGQRVNFVNSQNRQKEETFGYECKETLRKLVIGRTVTVRIDYSKSYDANENGAGGNREYATVSYKKNDRSQAVDLGEHLVSLGYATVLIPQGDNKSARYQALCDAEGAAKRTKLGLHSIKGSKIYIPGDSKLQSLEDQSKAKSYASVIQRASRRVRRLKGIVENVFGPTRVKVRLSVPGEKVKGGR